MDSYAAPTFAHQPSFMDQLNKRLAGIDELNAELAQSFFELNAKVLAQGAAIQALISATPDLDAAHEKLLSAMDITADHIRSKKQLELCQDELAHIQALILGEKARRRAA